MRLEILELIMDVAKKGSISAAAREGHIQQTTLSAAIKSLETELNIKIFDRQFNGVILTKEGEELVKLAEPMLELYHRMELISQSKGDTLTIHVNRLLYCYFCYDILPQLHMNFPESAMTISMTAEDPLKDTVPQCRFDIGIGCCWPEAFEKQREAAEAVGLKLVPLLTSEHRIYVHKDNPLSDREYIDDLEVMRNQRIVIAKSFYLERFYLSGMDKIVKSYSIMDTFDPMQLISAVSDGDSIAYAVDKQLIPARFHPLMDDIVSLQIFEPEGGERHFRYTIHYIICPKSTRQSATEKAIIDFLTEVLA